MIAENRSPAYNSTAVRTYSLPAFSSWSTCMQCTPARAMHRRRLSRSEARRIKAEKAGVPLVDFEEPKRESLTEVEKRARQFVDALVADADGDTFMQLSLIHI